MAQSTSQGRGNSGGSSRARASGPRPENTLSAARSAETFPAPNEAREGPPAGARSESSIAPKTARAREDAPSAKAASPEPAADDSARKRFERMPQAVLDRYYNIGERWFLESGDMAFVNHGDRLTTRSENQHIVRDMVAIAAENQIERLAVAGAENFRRAVWQEATRLGLAVEGFTPTEHDEKQLIQRIARESRGGDGAAQAAASAEERDSEQLRHDTARRVAADRYRESRAEANTDRAPADISRPGRDRFYSGELLEHRAENYHYNPNADMSYVVRLGTPTGTVELWGKDLERALKSSKTHPKVGDEVSIRQIGQQPVTVPESVHDGEGRVVGTREKAAHRNQWVIEKKEFFAERERMADTVRDPSVTAEQATKRHPQLVGTMSVLQEAEAFARTIGNAQTRASFLAATRDWVADEIARGEPLRTTKIRDRQNARGAEPGPRGPGEERVLS